MSRRVTRRQWLRHGTAAAVGVATVGKYGTWSAETKAARAAAPSLPVAIQRAESYEPQRLLPILNRALDLIGGIQTDNFLCQYFIYVFYRGQYTFTQKAFFVSIP